MSEASELIKDLGMTDGAIAQATGVTRLTIFNIRHEKTDGKRILPKLRILHANQKQPLNSVPITQKKETPIPKVKKQERKITPLPTHKSLAPATHAPKKLDKKPSYFTYKGKVYPGEYPNDLPDNVTIPSERRVTVIEEANVPQTALLPVPSHQQQQQKQITLASLPVAKYLLPISQLIPNLSRSDPTWASLELWQQRCKGESNLLGGIILSEQKQLELLNQCLNTYDFMTPRYHQPQRNETKIQSSPPQPSLLTRVLGNQTTKYVQGGYLASSYDYEEEEDETDYAENE